MPRRKHRNARISAAGLAGHWLYRVTMRAIEGSMRNPEYKVPGPGKTKRELAELAIAYQETNLPPEQWLTRSTINGYLNSGVVLRLYDAAGNGARRRYFPPGYLLVSKDAMKPEQRQALIEALAEEGKANPKVQRASKVRAT